MYILTNGKNYVMENPYKKGEYIETTSPVQAKEFSYKQAKKLLQNNKKSLSWVRNFQMLNQETGHIERDAKYRQGNGGAYIGDHDIEFNEEILNVILDESQSILGLAAWDSTQLQVYEEDLTRGLSKYDSAISDIGHALQKYKEDNNGTKPQAHKMAKIGYLLDEIRDKRKHIKQCLNYIKILQDAITYGYTIEKLKIEIGNAEFVDYKGRTEYYQRALDALEG